MTATLETLFARRPHAAGEKHRTLSKRETEVLQCLALAKSGREIGEALSISLRTVRVHIRGLRRKLNAMNVAHAVALGFHSGLLKLEQDHKCKQGIA